MEVGEGAVALPESRPTYRPCPISRARGCSPTKKERGCGTPETVRVKAKPARRKSISERMSGALRMSTSDLVASFASGSTEVMSSFGMGCDVSDGSDDSDSPPKNVSLMSPVEAARLVSAEFFREQQEAAVSPIADEIYRHTLPSLIDESCGKPPEGPFVPSTPETPATVESTPETPGQYGSPVAPYPGQFETIDDESVALEVGMSAESYLEECFIAEVSVLNREKFNTVPQLSRRDFTITRHLGKGSFSDVFEVSADIASSLKPKTAIYKARSRRASLATSINVSTLARPTVVGKNQEKLAMKCLRPQIRSDCDQFVIGAEDLVHETAMLASLDHPSIIKLHGRASGSLRDSFVLNDGYFILLDRLTGTLTDRLQEWKNVPERLMGPGRDELNVARSVADAVTYLHSKRIVFRDLKPDNVGFDSNGTLKLFDFGFAVGLPEKSEDNPTGLLTDRSGTPRYM